MKKQCEECKKWLEWNNQNFRCSGGFWRNKCRVCQNERKRLQYENRKAAQTKPLNPHQQAQKERVCGLIEKFDKIFKTMKRHGVNCENQAGDVDGVLKTRPFYRRSR